MPCFCSHWHSRASDFQSGCSSPISLWALPPSAASITKVISLFVIAFLSPILSPTEAYWRLLSEILVIRERFGPYYICSFLCSNMPCCQCHYSIQLWEWHNGMEYPAVVLLLENLFRSKLKTYFWFSLVCIHELSSLCQSCFIFENCHLEWWVTAIVSIFLFLLLYSLEQGILSFSPSSV